MSHIGYSISKGVKYYKIIESYREKGTGKAKNRILLNIGPESELVKFTSQLLKKQEEQSKDQQNSEVEVDIEEIRCQIHGAPNTLYEIAKWIGVDEVLSEIFPDQVRSGCETGDAILLAAIHRVCHPGSKRSFSEWFAETSLPDRLKLDPEKFTSQTFWDQMNVIDINKLQAAEDKIVRKIFELFPDEKKQIEVLNLDYSNYFMFLSSANIRCHLAQRGKNKQGRDDLKQVAIAVITTPILQIPIATMLYDGNLNDKVAFQKFMDEVNKRLSDLVDLSNITLVFDGGSIGEENLKLIKGHFISRGSFSSLPDLYDVPRSEYQDVTLDDGVTIVKAYRTTREYMGDSREIILTLSDELMKGQMTEQDKQEAKLKTEIENVNQMLANPKSTIDKSSAAIKARVDKLLLRKYHFETYVSVEYETESVPDPKILKAFLHEQELKRKPKNRNPLLEGISSISDIPTITITKSVQISFDADKKAWIIDKYYGKCFIFTDQQEWTTSKIISTYRDQECIEGIFRDSKCGECCSVRPIYHWTEQKVRVHVYLCYLGLTLMRVLQHLLRNSSIRISTKTLIQRLNRVKKCYVLVAVKNSKGDMKPQVKKKIAKMSPTVESTWNDVCKVLSNLPKPKTERNTA